MYGDDITINVASVESSPNIRGQMAALWTSETKFTGPASTFKLESSEGNITINYAFISGDILRIDYHAREISINNKLINVGLSLDSVWFALPNGSVKLKASHNTQLTYTERYY